MEIDFVRDIAGVSSENLTHLRALVGIGYSCLQCRQEPQVQLPQRFPEICCRKCTLLVGIFYMLPEGACGSALRIRLLL
jgi:hypothetical protein